MRIPSIIFAVGYGFYCFATSERDFLFVIFALLLYTEVGRGVWAKLMPILALLGAVLGAALFSSRQNLEFGLGSFLNQGSILFVDTFLVKEIPTLTDAELHTYARIVGLNPDGIQGNLSSWLVETYAGSATGSGYGFSLTGEAFMNFGMPMVIILAVCIGLSVEILERWPLTTHFRLFTRPLVLTLLLYGFRSDLRTMLVGIIEGCLIFWLLWVASVPALTKRRYYRGPDTGKDVRPEHAAARRAAPVTYSSRPRSTRKVIDAHSYHRRRRLHRVESGSDGVSERALRQRY